MFCKIVSLICCPFFPFDCELLLSHSVSQPIIFHVPTFGAFSSHRQVNKARCGSIIGDYLCFSLVEVHFLDGIAYTDGDFAVVENTATFGFRCRTDDVLEGITFGEDRDIMCSWKEN